MKKKIWIILLFVVLIVSLAYSCRPSPESMATVGELSKIEEVNTVDGLTAICSPTQMSRFRKSITITLTNDTAKDYGYAVSSSHYEHPLEIQVDGQWYRVAPAAEKGTVFEFAEFYPILGSGKKLEFQYDFRTYGHMPAGHYRYVFQCEEADNASDSTIHHIVVEFTLR